MTGGPGACCGRRNQVTSRGSFGRPDSRHSWNFLAVKMPLQIPLTIQTSQSPCSTRFFKKTESVESSLQDSAGRVSCLSAVDTLHLQGNRRETDRLRDWLIRPSRLIVRGLAGSIAAGLLQMSRDLVGESGELSLTCRR